MLTPESVKYIKPQIDSVPLFKNTLKRTIREVDTEIAMGIDVPIPKDMAGGYTHERHKKNFLILQKAGNLFQFTGEEKYAVYIRDMLLEYASLFPTLGIHPTNKSYAPGKIFWQCLNDANWLVYVSQAYDCIYDWLAPEQVKHLNTQLFRPYADFISIENPQFFNRIHNHSTWGNAAVGMIGLVMNDEELVQRALYGIESDGLSEDQIDNDGGYIKIAGIQQAGFLAQLDYSFSPDGYFTEGPYYLRYAMTPFLLFGKALENNRPDFGILGYRDSILLKAVDALLNQTDAKGRFFPINDAQKGMSWLSREVIGAVDIAYFHGGRDPGLLSIAKLQNHVLLDETGFAVARDIDKGLLMPFQHKSAAYVDGADGEKGGLGILRTPHGDEGELCLVMKYTAHGMGHGHFDKLSFSLYDESGEVVQDYGSVRWVNIDQKGGGRYLPENNTWAKQSVAHNTLVVNEKSHYDGDIEKGEANQPDFFFFEAENDKVQLVSAKDAFAYPGAEMHRTMVLLKDTTFEKPLVIDVFRVTSDSENQYDLPLWFNGHLLTQNFDYQSETTSWTLLGTAHGYQHLRKEAVGKTTDSNARFTWLGNGHFYTQTSVAAPEDELIFARLGANDPNFTLRHDPVFIHRKNREKNAVFVSVIEPHGEYNPVEEIPVNSYGKVASVQLLEQSTEYTAFEFKSKTGKTWTILLANEDASEEQFHSLQIGQERYDWRGFFHILTNFQ